MLRPPGSILNTHYGDVFVRVLGLTMVDCRERPTRSLFLVRSSLRCSVFCSTTIHVRAFVATRRYCEGARGASRGAVDDACQQAGPARGDPSCRHIRAVRHAQDHKSGVSITTLQRPNVVSDQIVGLALSPRSKLFTQHSYRLFSRQRTNPRRRCLCVLAPCGICHDAVFTEINVLSVGATCRVQFWFDLNSEHTVYVMASKKYATIGMFSA